MTDTEATTKTEEKPVIKAQDGEEKKTEEVKEKDVPPVTNGVGNGDAEEGKEGDIDEALSTILNENKDEDAKEDEPNGSEEKDETTQEKKNPEESVAAIEKPKPERGGHQNKNTKKNNKIILKGFPLEKYVKVRKLPL